ncbi:alpha/beta hydrolase [Caballeronia sp. GAWG1-1]|uniref:alpha/beta fold hydrolase n=1 Tax=Caballeronia sp. GAWG1-1 TaxID=2921742 RepID=UPI0020279F80|nr:alpha/beta hydrolase [Caballeronia sp. GAWG1-1]
MINRIETDLLDIAYEESGPTDGWPVVLLHGFPYDIHSFDEAAPLLVAQGARVIVPYLRGYGPTRFLSADTPRSGQQAALGADLLALLDALDIERAMLGGYDWGGRAACIVAALHPERVRALVTLNGYNIQDIAASGKPSSPENELRYWYQYYFHGERGRAGLTAHRRELCRLLWTLWSPSWRFDDDTYAATAASFDNEDFIDVVIHSYRHRYGLVNGDPRYDALEQQLAKAPPISVPTISFDGADDGVMSTGGTAHHSVHFSGPFEYRVVEGAGHNLPQEKPEAFADALLTLHART